MKVHNDVKAQKNDVLNLKSKKEEIDEFIAQRGQEVTVTLLKELDVIKDEMKKGFANQRSEYLRLNQQITQLQSEENTIRSQIEQVEKRVKEIELQVGGIDI
jgi:predicted  nucleic acid-binding Zn-ribbon protein